MSFTIRNLMCISERNNIFLSCVLLIVVLCRKSTKANRMYSCCRTKIVRHSVDQKAIDGRGG